MHHAERANIRRVLLKYVNSPEELRRHASDVGIDVHRIHFHAILVEQCLFEVIDETLRGPGLGVLAELCALIIGGRHDPDLELTRGYLREMGWAPKSKAPDFLLPLRLGDWLAALRLLDLERATENALLDRALRTLTDPWHAVARSLAPPALAEASTETKMDTWRSELDEALRLCKHVGQARDCCARWGCDIAERRLEVMEARLRLVTVHRTLAPLRGLSPYQSILRHTRDKHPTTAARLAWLWGAALAIETGRLQLLSPARNVNWEERPRQLIAASVLSDEVELARNVLAEMRPSDRDLAEWLAALGECLSMSVEAATRSAPARLRALQSAALIAPDDLDVSILQALIAPEAASSLRERIEKAPHKRSEKSLAIKTGTPEALAPSQPPGLSVQS